MFDAVLKEIFGEEPYNGEDALKILNYCYLNPKWRNLVAKRGGTYRDNVMLALSRAVEEIYQVPFETFMGRSRRRNIADVRDMAIYLYHKETGQTACAMGRIFSKNHSTILHIYKQVEALRRSSRQFRADFANLEKKFTNYLCEI